MPGSLAAELQLLQKLPPPRRPRLLTHRESVLDEMLDHYSEAQETLYSGGGGDDAADGGVLLMPAVWTDSYRELERSLKRMGGLESAGASPQFKRWFWHLCEWYLRCTKIPKVSEQKTVRRGIEIVELPRTVRMHVVRKGEPTLVLLGLEWVAAEFVGEPFLPSEILEPMAA